MSTTSQHDSNLPPTPESLRPTLAGAASACHLVAALCERYGVPVTADRLLVFGAVMEDLQPSAEDAAALAALAGALEDGGGLRLPATPQPVAGILAEALSEAQERPEWADLEPAPVTFQDRGGNGGATPPRPWWASLETGAMLAAPPALPELEDVAALLAPALDALEAAAETLAVALTRERTPAALVAAAAARLMPGAVNVAELRQAVRWLDGSGDPGRAIRRAGDEVAAGHGGGAYALAVQAMRPDDGEDDGGGSEPALRVPPRVGVGAEDRAALGVFLCERSAELAAHDPHEARHVAGVAVHLTRGREWYGWALAVLANAHRVAGDLDRAGELIGKAVTAARESSRFAPAPAAAELAHVLSLHASIELDRGNLDHAAELVELGAAAARKGMMLEDRAQRHQVNGLPAPPPTYSRTLTRLLLKGGLVDAQRGRLAEAVRSFALVTASTAATPWERFAAGHSAAAYLARAGHLVEARGWYAGIAPAYRLFSSPLVDGRRAWLLAMFAAGDGDRQGAALRFAEALDAFEAGGYHLDAALCRVDALTVALDTGDAAGAQVQAQALAEWAGSAPGPWSTSAGKAVAALAALLERGARAQAVAAELAAVRQAVEHAHRSRRCAAAA